MIKRLLFCVALPVYLTACNKPPEACIETNATSITAGDSITFTSCSKRALSQDWFMTGPANAVENNMGWSDATFTHRFDSAGSYEVRLNAYSKFSFMGDVNTATQTITVQ